MRRVPASPLFVYRSFVDADALMSWLPPTGMTGQVYEFDARAGGVFHMALQYVDAEGGGDGKSSENTDVVRGRFLELVPNERIVWLVAFESDDPQFHGEMKMTWSLSAVPDGTEVVVTCEHVPPGIRQADHEAGMRSTLDHLAAYAKENAGGAAGSFRILEEERR